MQTRTFRFSLDYSKDIGWNLIPNKKSFGPLFLFDPAADFAAFHVMFQTIFPRVPALPAPLAGIGAMMWAGCAIWKNIPAAIVDLLSDAASGRLPFNRNIPQAPAVEGNLTPFLKIADRAAKLGKKDLETPVSEFER